MTPLSDPHDYVYCTAWRGKPLTSPRVHNQPQVARDSLRVMLDGAEPGIEALHAGLECGVIGDKAPGMDIVRSSMICR